MVKKVLIDLDDVEHKELLVVKGDLTWKGLLLSTLDD